MRIVFAGTPEFAVASLDELYKKGHDISLVISQMDRPRGRGKKLQSTPVKKKAIELGLDVYQPNNINSEESIKKLKEINPDFLIVVAYGQILRKQVLEIPNIETLNVHASLLPKYRGAAPINWSIINGEKMTGVTIMRVEEGLDTGDMISKISTAIDDEDDAISIHDRLSSLGGELLVATLDDIIEGRAVFTPQNDEESSYAPILSREDGRIDWGTNSIEIFNQVRGLKPWPGTFTHYEDQKIKIHKLMVTDKKSLGEPGEIIQVSNDGIYVNTKDKVVIIEELQFPNKRSMKVSEYLAGNKLDIGIILK
ncbi:MAG TPA: methionyl-tRNA formyltransferase [Tissierellaceae bacterium]|nr:methionyl-tRNA formyltransferase [Tissierellaceae bacterium]